MTYKILFLAAFACLVGLSQAITISHENLPSFNNNGNQLMRVATPSLGAVETEVWFSSIAVGSQTPLHIHEAEEIVILLSGSLEATVDGDSSNCTGPCTIILPANKKHMLKNIGDIRTNHYSIVRSQSKIYDQNNQEMKLPWRK